MAKRFYCLVTLGEQCGNKCETISVMEIIKNVQSLFSQRVFKNYKQSKHYINYSSHRMKKKHKKHVTNFMSLLGKDLTSLGEQGIRRIS